MGYSKPQVTIDLDEYNHLKEQNIEIYQKALFDVFDTVCNRPDYNIGHLSSTSYARETANYIKMVLNKKGIQLLFNEDEKVLIVKLNSDEKS